MNKAERQNYQTGLWISLGVHFLLLIMFSWKTSQNFLKQPVKVETFSVGLVELPFGSGNGTGEKIGKSADNALQTKIETVEVKQVVSEQQTPVSNISNEKPVTLTKEPLTENQEGLAVAKLIENIKKVPDNSGAVFQDKNQVDNQANFTNKTPKFVVTGLGTGEGLVGTVGGNGNGGGGGRLQPAYPKNAVNEEKEGEVLARILVQQSGNLEEVKLMKSSGDERLDKAVLTSIQKQWKFKAAVANYYVEVLFSFKIETGVTLTFLKAETRS